jgi:hypothetical protein
MANYQQTSSVNGLQTFTILNAPVAGIYFVNGQWSLPMPTGSGPSSIVCTIKQNGSTIYTGIAGATGAQINQIVCAAADVITAVFSSSVAVDEALNALQGVFVAGNAF